MTRRDESLHQRSWPAGEAAGGGGGERKREREIGGMEWKGRWIMRRRGEKGRDRKGERGKVDIHYKEGKKGRKGEEG